ncbi:MAG: NAD-binding protein [Ardenticatenales bacterium]
MPHDSWSDRLRYRFDNFMSRGTPAMVSGLGLISLGVIFAAAALLVALRIRPSGENEPLGFLEAAWQSLMHALDSGAVGGDTGWSLRIVMFLVTLGGLFIISALIGIISAGIDERLAQLRQGRSRVIESGHVLVVGWSPKVFTVLSELAAANANVRRPCAVVLGPEDKVTMESEIRARVDAGNLRIVCRSGNPLDPADLRIGNPAAARAIIVLPTEGADADIQTIKTLLALSKLTADVLGDCPVIAAVRHAANADAVRLASGGRVKVVLVDDLIARITAQACRQSGLSIVLQELLNFEGEEIYFADQGAVRDQTYGEALHALTLGAGIGIRRADGGVVLNPPFATRIDASDRLIVIATDDDQIAFAAPPPNAVDAEAIVRGAQLAAGPEHTLVLGWNRRGDRLVSQLDRYVSPGSTVRVIAPADEVPAAPDDARLQNVRVHYSTGDPCDRATLDALGIAEADHIIVLSGDGHLDPQASDARTLITLLHLRDIAEKASRDLSVVSEMLDDRNQELADVTRADDFIVSDRLVSLLLTQLAENPGLEAVFDDLFDPTGAEIYLKPAGAFVALGAAVTFHTVIASALEQGATAIGYRIAVFATQPSRGHGIVINPAKLEPIVFGPADQVIVLADD